MSLTSVVTLALIRTSSFLPPLPFLLPPLSSKPPPLSSKPHPLRSLPPPLPSLPTLTPLPPPLPSPQTYGVLATSPEMSSRGSRSFVAFDLCDGRSRVNLACYFLQSERRLPNVGLPFRFLMRPRVFEL